MDKKLPANKISSLTKYSSKFNRTRFKNLHEEMSFAEYIERLPKNPLLVRTAYQYLWDTVSSFGVSKFERYRKTYTKYSFFDDPALPDPIFGLEETLDALMNFIKGAAGRYGTERRVLLLHGPVGSSKSTICRRFKRGLEHYSETDAGAWYTHKWVNLPSEIYTSVEDHCPMHEDPIHLMDLDMRSELLKDVNFSQADDSEDHRAYELFSEGTLCPRCQDFMDLLLAKYDGDWEQVVNNHIRVFRQTHSEARRMGIGTFQPKDEKNQDATELTGDLNWGKIGHFGKDSDSRAFNFDGEFCVSNRGIFELIEVLKLHQEFLYDLLGASQEHNIKPKKFPQICVDEIIVGHSVHGSTPVPHEYDGVLDVLPIEEMKKLDVSKLRVFSVNVETHEVELSPVKSVFSHEFKGTWVENHQDDDILVTTPNHSVYNTNYETFYPGDDESSEILTLDIPKSLVEGKPTTSTWDAYFTMRFTKRWDDLEPKADRFPFAKWIPDNLLTVI